jgi:hypothetical protein
MGGIAAKKTVYLDLDDVRAWVEKAMHPDDFAKIGIVEAGRTIWVVNIDYYDSELRESLKRYAEAHYCGISLHQGKSNSDHGYCILGYSR